MCVSVFYASGEKWSETIMVVYLPSENGEKFKEFTVVGLAGECECQFVWELVRLGR